jgi:hypothetical protein
MTKWLIHRLLTAKHQCGTSVIFQLYCAEWRNENDCCVGDNFLYTWWCSDNQGPIFDYLSGTCLAYGVYFLSQLSEKGYRFLFGLFFKNWGLGTCSYGAAEPRPLYILILKPILDPISDCCLTKSSLSPNFWRIIQAKTYTPFQTVVTKSIPNMPDRRQTDNQK